jgi:phage gp36-like protein
MAYCEANDLIVGDIAGLEPLKQRFIDAATDEMDAMIGFVYLLPLSGLSTHVTLLLKSICSQLASGRLLTSQSAASEDQSTHSYGKSLIDSATAQLWSIRNGQTALGALKVTSAASGGNAPSIGQTDSVSAVDAFYDYVSNPLTLRREGVAIWKPGV